MKLAWGFGVCQIHISHSIQCLKSISGIIGQKWKVVDQNRHRSNFKRFGGRIDFNQYWQRWQLTNKLTMG